MGIWGVVDVDQRPVEHLRPHLLLTMLHVQSLHSFGEVRLQLFLSETLVFVMHNRLSRGHELHVILSNCNFSSTTHAIIPSPCRADYIDWSECISHSSINCCRGHLIIV